MRFRSYEKAEGWSPGQPEVLFTGTVQNRLGTPVVDHDSLHQYFTDELEIPYDRRSTMYLYGGARRKPKKLGYHQRFSKSFHVNAPVAERRLAYAGGTMRVVAHEGSHLRDSSNHKLRELAEGSMALGTFLAAASVVRAAGRFERHNPLTVLSGLGLAELASQKIEDSAEARAREQEQHPSTMEHETDIIFPNSPRTDFLVQRGIVSPDIF